MSRVHSYFCFDCDASTSDGLHEGDTCPACGGSDFVYDLNNDARCERRGHDDFDLYVCKDFNGRPWQLLCRRCGPVFDLRIVEQS